MTHPTAAPDSSNRLLAALAYPIWIIALVMILTDMKKDAFLRRHGWTALFWGVGWAVLYLALAIVTSIPFLGWLGALLAGPLLGLAWLVLSLYCAFQAYNGRDFTIPVVSNWAQKYVA